MKNLLETSVITAGARQMDLFGVLRPWLMSFGVAVTACVARRYELGTRDFSQLIFREEGSQNIDWTLRSSYSAMDKA